MGSMLAGMGADIVLFTYYYYCENHYCTWGGQLDTMVRGSAALVPLCTFQSLQALAYNGQMTFAEWSTRMGN